MDGGGWTDVTPLPRCRFECGAATLDCQLYVLGGMVCDSQEGVPHRTHDHSVDKWNPASNQWSQVSHIVGGHIPRGGYSHTWAW